MFISQRVGCIFSFKPLVSAIIALQDIWAFVSNCLHFGSAHFIVSQKKTCKFSGNLLGATRFMVKVVDY